MPNQPGRRVPAVIAGVLAMAASFSALGAIVVSDIARASPSIEREQLSDELPAAPPVKMTKVVVKADEGFELLELLQAQPRRKPIKRVDFGSFEGY
jgi:hypothetical protein